MRCTRSITQRLTTVRIEFGPPDSSTPERPRNRQRSAYMYANRAGNRVLSHHLHTRQQPALEAAALRHTAAGRHTCPLRANKACRVMLALIGAAGLWSIQYAVQHLARKNEQSNVAKRAIKAASRNHSVTSSAERPSASVDSSRSSYQQHGRSCTARDGMFVCFRDRTGQVAVIQPYGNGGSWQLTVTCASGGCCLLPEGAGNLCHICGDAIFLVHQVGQHFAFSSPGAGGRYLSAARDLNVPPVLDNTKLTPASQWKVSAQGISNVLHPHKKLCFSLCEVKLVPLESITSVERSIADFHQGQLDKVSAAEAASRALQTQLQEAAKVLTQTTAEYDNQVQALKSQLGEACMFNTKLTELIEAKDGKLQVLKDHFTQIKTKYQEAERELTTAYTEVATLQQQLAERDEDVHHLQQRMCNETKQWNQLRAALQDSLQAKDEEIAALSLQVQRMEHALRAVEHTLYGMRKPTRLDRASLDAVSIHQLQAAVDNFAAAGEGVMMAPEETPMSTEEAEALRVLLEQQTAGSTGCAVPAGFDLEPGTELSLPDLDKMDQGSPDKHRAAASADATKAAAKSPTRAAGASAAAAVRSLPGPSGAVAGRATAWSVAHSSGGVGGRGLLSTWGLSEDTTLTNSRGARSSGNSEGRHRYSGDTSDGDSQDEDGLVQQASECDVAGGDDADLDTAVCTSMDEDELQQQLGRLKASASQFPGRASGSKDTNSTLLQQKQQPLHTLKPAGVTAAAGTASSGSRPYASMSQLSPVKEEQIGHTRSHTSAGLSAGGGKP